MKPAERAPEANPELSVPGGEVKSSVRRRAAEPTMRAEMATSVPWRITHMSKWKRLASAWLIRAVPTHSG